MPMVEDSPKTYKTLRSFNTGGRDYGSGEPFPADGHDVPIEDIMVLQQRDIIAEATWSKGPRAQPDDSLRQENEALKARVAELEAQLADNGAGEGEVAPRRRGRPPKVRTEEIGNADEA